MYVGIDEWASLVMRIGWGEYAGQVRVAKVDADFTTYSTGRWVRGSSCEMLEPGDTLRATADLEDATKSRREIVKDSVWKFVNWDEDGDVVLRSGIHERTIFKEQLVTMTLI